MVESVDEVKDEVWSFFKNKFSEPKENRPFLEDFNFKSLNVAEVEYLKALFLDEEIKEAVWSCDGSKSLGPDEFYFVFINGCWNIIKEDITKFVKDFHGNAFLPKAVTSSFMTLIPKFFHPYKLEEYKPICLVG